VPFVGRFISQAPAVNEGLPVMAKVTNLKKLIWTGLANGNSGKFQVLLFCGSLPV
jgi:hypothetical protein